MHKCGCTGTFYVRQKVTCTSSYVILTSHVSPKGNVERALESNDCSLSKCRRHLDTARISSAFYPPYTTFLSPEFQLVRHETSTPGDTPTYANISTHRPRDENIRWWFGSGASGVARALVQAFMCFFRGVVKAAFFAFLAFISLP